MKTLFTILFFSIIPLTTFAADCKKANEALPKSVMAANVFNQLYDFYGAYSSCLDGAIAETSAAIVTDAFAKNWKQLNSFNSLAMKDPKFKKFMLNSFEPNVTAQEGEVAQIIKLARENCPQDLKSLCQEIKKACEKSLSSK